jgi:hypothetical protein
VTMALAIVFMGVASPLFTSRMAAATDNVLKPFNQMQDVARPPAVKPESARAAVLPQSGGHASLKPIAERRRP